MEPEDTSAGSLYALAMVVCDFVWRDPGTGKPVLLRTFSSIAASAFPCSHPVMAVFVAVTDGRRKTPIRLRLVDADDDKEPLLEGEVDVEWSDPRMTRAVPRLVWRYLGGHDRLGIISRR
jgi:hypothetical protein